MKQTYFLGGIAAAVAVAATALSGCESPTRLAAKVQGAWTGSPQHFDRELAVDGQYTPTFEFALAPDSKTAGDMVYTAATTVTYPINTDVATADGNSPISVTASAIVTVKGNWAAKDDDDMLLYFDAETMDVAVDPDAEFTYVNVLTAADVPQVAPIDSVLQATVRASVTKAVGATVAKIRKIEDIHITDRLMKCDLGKHHPTVLRKL